MSLLSAANAFARPANSATSGLPLAGKTLPDLRTLGVTGGQLVAGYRPRQRRLFWSGVAAAAVLAQIGFTLDTLTGLAVVVEEVHGAQDWG
ncbi:MAG TPA: hypothetical protein VFE65_05350 [Pseudonocardia sp.]|jgi:hypothetical protein|nr:hypothetical protein [Pseudonocardia sp.]